MLTPGTRTPHAVDNDELIYIERARGWRREVEGEDDVILEDKRSRSIRPRIGDLAFLFLKDPNSNRALIAGMRGIFLGDSNQ
jgi:hypothetical protein